MKTDLKQLTENQQESLETKAYSLRSRVQKLLDDYRHYRNINDDNVESEEVMNDDLYNALNCAVAGLEEFYEKI